MHVNKCSWTILTAFECSLCNQCSSAWPSLQGRRNQYQQKGGDTLWLGSKGRHGACVGGR